jgi:hypothetical protein
MLTDLHLRKYLEGRLSRREERELETLFEKNPAMKERLEELRSREHSVTRPAWERLFLDRGTRRGSKVRYSTILPALLILLLILGLTSHWFGKPGGSSTFVHVAGNGTAVELLYNSSRGWRYLDAGYRPGDSLTFAVKDSGRYAVRVFGLGGEKRDPAAWEIPFGLPEKKYGGRDPKPVFPSRASEDKPLHYLAVVYDTASLEGLTLGDVSDLLEMEGGAGGRSASFWYQIFRAPDPGAAP